MCRQHSFLPSIEAYLKIKGFGEQSSAALILCLLLGRYLKKLLVGQQQRAAIARALYMEPKIYWPDEPANGLDRRNAEAVMRLRASLARELECTLLLCYSHGEKWRSIWMDVFVYREGNCMLWPVVKALLGHYRRYPLQIILVWLIQPWRIIIG